MRTEREREREKEKREREWFGEHLSHSTLHIKPFVLLLIRCPHGTVLLDMVGMDHMAIGMDVDVAAGVVHSEDEWFCQKCSTGNWWSRTDCRHCECRERRRGYPAVVHSGKIGVLEKTLAGMGDDEPISAGKRVLEKELEKLQKKLDGPKKTAKHFEARQNWINRESKRLEEETARLTELQERLRVRKETLKVAYEEIKILREDLLRGRNERYC